jgi:hypothetical protein
MKIRGFFLNDNQWDMLNAFISNDNIVVKKTAIAPHEATDDKLYVFYEEAEDQLAREKEELSKLNKIAIELEKDEDYGKLKNSTQRELFILQKHNIPSGLAKKTIELVNTRKILQQE